MDQEQSVGTSLPSIPEIPLPHPEKPLEVDSLSNSGSNGDLRQKKKSFKKFRFPFTKSRRSSSLECENIAGDEDKSGPHVTPQVSIEHLQTQSSHSDQIITLKHPAERSVQPSGNSVAFQENVRVEVYNDNEPNENQWEFEEEKPPPACDKRGRPRNAKKVVTINESPRPVKRCSPQSLGEPVGRRRQNRSSTSGRSSSCSNRPVEQPGKMDARVLRKKYKHLLSFMEELTENNEYFKNALKQKENNHDKERIRHRKETESLNMQLYKLGQEVDGWREECQKMQNKSTALIKLKSLTQENQDLLADVDVHKSVIIRLNKELAYYQDKLRFKHKDTPEEIPVYSSGGDTDDYGRDGTSSDSERIADWLQNPRKSLLPLLIAYDEAIADKDDLLKEYEVTIARFKGKCMEIIKENESLHQLISSNKERGSISIEEWEFLRSNAEIVLEENDLLHEQVDNLKRKEEKLFSSFQVKAAEFKQTLTQHEAVINTQQSRITELETRCKQLSEEHSNMAASLHSRIPREKHEEMVQDFKRAFEELKGKYENDKKSINEKLAAAQHDKDELEEEVSNLENEAAHLRREIKQLEGNLAASTEALEELKTSLLKSTSARDRTSGMMEDFMKHVEQLATEKNKLSEDLDQQRLLNEQMMSLRSKENELVKQLHDKIEAMERLHKDEVKSLQAKLKECEDAIKEKSERHRRETINLNELIEEKDKRIEAIEQSKKQLQQDLETVWRTTTNTMTASLKNRHTPHT